MTLDPQTRARRAQEILNDPMVTEAFQQIEQNCWTAWQSSTSAETREEIWRRLQAMQAFRNYFAGVIGDVTIAQPAEPEPAIEQLSDSYI